MNLETAKAIFFWFALTLIGCLIAFQLYKRDQLYMQQIDVTPKAAPDFMLDDVQLSKLKGKTVLLHFWATWCEPCRAEMPLLANLSKRVKDLVILAVAVDSTKADVERFFGPQRPGFPVLLDLKHQVASLYGISQFPETLLIGPDGMIRALYIGPQDWDQFELKP
ncbi:MAG: TlpA disulfide reductase family protein [Myxococcota bacterium]